MTLHSGFLVLTSALFMYLPAASLLTPHIPNFPPTLHLKAGLFSVSGFALSSSLQTCSLGPITRTHRPQNSRVLNCSHSLQPIDQSRLPTEGNVHLSLHIFPLMPI